MDLTLCAPCVKATSLRKLGDGDISGILAQAMKNAVSISAPVFFATNSALFQETIAAIQFGFSGIAVSPCAIPIVPIGVVLAAQVWRPDLAARLCTGHNLTSPLFCFGPS